VRASLSVLGISIGIAAIVGVLGISQSSKSGCWPNWAGSAT
jgi:ABC-type antimicrobial peptide transport system permease subunit